MACVGIKAPARGIVMAGLLCLQAVLSIQLPVCVLCKHCVTQNSGWELAVCVFVCMRVCVCVPMTAFDCS